MEKVKEIIKNLTIKRVQLSEQGKKLSAKVDEQQKQIGHLTDKVMEQIKDNNIIRNLTGEYKKIELDCWEGVRAQLERMKELCKECGVWRLLCPIFLW